MRSPRCIGRTEALRGPAPRRGAGAIALLGRASAAALLAGVSALVLAAGPVRAAEAEGGGWPLAGQDLANDRSEPGETAIGTGDVGKLKPKWVFTTHGEVSATPTVAGGIVYFPDWGGYLNAVDGETGRLLWQKRIPEYTHAFGTVSRVSPAIYGNELILGDNIGSPLASRRGAHIFAVNRFSGALIWIKEVDFHSAAIITSSPEVVGNKVVVGVSSGEEDLATRPGYPCCTFRGSVVALNAETGAMLWKAYMVPPNFAIPCTKKAPIECGYSGAAVWSPPAVEPATKTVYVGTGNNYTVPYAAEKCQMEAEEHETSDEQCTSPSDLFDSVVALNLETGAIRWAHKVEGWDAFTVACLLRESGFCPTGRSKDFDFGGGGPNLFTASGTRLVGDGQKSGIYWVFNAATGKIAWETLVGPGTGLGGIEWGTAYDGSRIYVPEADPPTQAPPIEYKLAGGESVAGGSWAALNPNTGAFDWQVPAPGGASALGPPSATDGVVFVGSMASTEANMFALEAATGRQLWSYRAEGSVNAGPAIVGGVVYWGSGYARFGREEPTWTTSHKLYAFSIEGK
jgi:polyvinyl alcohol dehydrogenase (cytochrome)